MALDTRQKLQTLQLSHIAGSGTLYALRDKRDPLGYSERVLGAEGMLTIYSLGCSTLWLLNPVMQAMPTPAGRNQSAPM